MIILTLDEKCIDYAKIIQTLVNMTFGKYLFKEGEFINSQEDFNTITKNGITYAIQGNCGRIILIPGKKGDYTNIKKNIKRMYSAEINRIITNYKQYIPSDASEIHTVALVNATYITFDMDNTCYSKSNQFKWEFAHVYHVDQSLTFIEGYDDISSEFDSMMKHNTLVIDLNDVFVKQNELVYVNDTLDRKLFQLNDRIVEVNVRYSKEQKLSQILTHLFKGKFNVTSTDTIHTLLFKKIHKGKWSDFEIANKYHNELPLKWVKRINDMKIIYDKKIRVSTKKNEMLFVSLMTSLITQALYEEQICDERKEVLCATDFINKIDEKMDKHYMDIKPIKDKIRKEQLGFKGYNITAEAYKKKAKLTIAQQKHKNGMCLLCHIQLYDDVYVLTFADEHCNTLNKGVAICGQCIYSITTLVKLSFVKVTRVKHPRSLADVLKYTKVPFATKRIILDLAETLPEVVTVNNPFNYNMVTTKQYVGVSNIYAILFKLVTLPNNCKGFKLS